MSTPCDILGEVCDLPQKDDTDIEDFTASEFQQRHRHSYRSSSLIPASSAHNIRDNRKYNSIGNLEMADMTGLEWHRKPATVQNMDVHSISVPDKITKSIYLGDRYSAYNFEWLLSNGITHIINIAALSCPCFYPGTFKYLSVEVEDSVSKDISQFFDVCTRFINKAVVQHGGKVLVHCEAGKSRSASIVMQYLVREQGMTLKHAYKLVKRSRIFVMPNISFFAQLRRFELETTGVESLPLSVPCYILHNFKLEQKILRERKFRRIVHRFLYPFNTS